MLHMLKNGDRVTVWPMPGLRVKVGPDSHRDINGVPTLVEARLLSDKGEEVEWSSWWHDLARGGALAFSDPKTITQCKHVHPDDVGANDKNAREAGSDVVT
jgi:hypothetical protein